jgi:hypothetical protein
MEATVPDTSTGILSDSLWFVQLNRRALLASQGDHMRRIAPALLRLIEVTRCAQKAPMPRGVRDEDVHDAERG